MARKIITIKEVRTGNGPFVLTVRHDGGEFMVDISDHIHAAQHVFKPLLLAPHRLSDVAVDEYGSCVGWYFDGTDDMEIPADLLWRLHLYQTGRSLSPQGFAEWRKRMGWSKKRIAEELDMSRRMVELYESGQQIIPRTVVLSCQRLELAQDMDQFIKIRDGLDNVIKAVEAESIRTGTNGQ